MTEEVYGTPPEQVVGSTIQTQYEVKDGKPVLMRLPKSVVSPDEFWQYAQFKFMITPVISSLIQNPIFGK